MRGLKIALMLVGLLAVVQQSEQFNLNINKLFFQETKSYEDDKPQIGLVFASYYTEKAFNESGLFTANSYYEEFGRRVVVGSIKGYPVAYVTSASTPSIHVGISVHLLTTFFKLKGIVYVGTAGATNNSISLGSVVVPNQIAFTGAWRWRSKNASEKGQLVFGQFNYPTRGENLLGSIFYAKSYIYNNRVNGTYFWIPVDVEWLRIASKVEIKEGDVLLGLRGSSSDICVKNPSYGEFLYKTFNVSAVYISTAAAAFGALQDNIKFIAFEGISNKAGASSEENKTALANANAVKAAIMFIRYYSISEQH